jgi:hemerythrin-like metal-binding protein
VPLDTGLDHIDVFPWNTNFETGIESIDQQHQKLVSLLNELAGTLVDDDHVEIQRVFGELAEYASYHFESEEAVWAEAFADDDPWAVAHKGSHDWFLPAVVEMKEKDKDKPLTEVVEDIVKFLIRWLAFHIIAEDKRMSLAVMACREGKSMSEAKAHSDEHMKDFSAVLVDAVLGMYESLSSRTLELMRERVKRKKMEQQLRELNKELEIQSITDQLTGLNNRRHFDKVLDQELKRCVREKRNLALMMIDIDYFKRLNDHYGHIQGDRALQDVAQCLMDHCQRP